MCDTHRRISGLFGFTSITIIPRPKYERSESRAAYPRPVEMLINLLPDFFNVLDSTDRLAAYQRYFAAHRRILEPYWHNYVIDPDSPHFTDIARSTVNAGRADLRTMLEHTDVVTLARSTEQQC